MKSNKTTYEGIRINQAIIQLQESAELVNTTANVKVFFERFEFCIRLCDELIDLEYTGLIRGISPLQQKNDFFKCLPGSINSLIFRSHDKAVASALELKTEKGRHNRIINYYQNLIIDLNQCGAKYLTESNIKTIRDLVTSDGVTDEIEINLTPGNFVYDMHENDYIAPSRMFMLNNHWILKYIPGFRSGKAWKMILASIYYLFTIYVVADGSTYPVYVKILQFARFLGFAYLVAIIPRPPAGTKRIVFAVIGALLIGVSFLSNSLVLSVPGGLTRGVWTSGKPYTFAVKTKTNNLDCYEPGKYTFEVSGSNSPTYLVYTSTEPKTAITQDDTPVFVTRSFFARKINFTYTQKIRIKPRFFGHCITRS